MTAEGIAPKSGLRHRRSMTSNDVLPPPRLEGLAADPTRVGTLTPDAVIRLLAQCLSLQVGLVGRLLASSQASMQDAPAERLLTMQDVAARLSVPQTYAYELARRRDLPAVKLGKYVRVRADEFESWLDALKTALNMPPAPATVVSPVSDSGTRAASTQLTRAAIRIEKKRQRRRDS